MTVAGPDGERETRRYRAVLVANGHHWDPRWPEPAFPGAEEFGGEQIHVHHYREPDILPGKRVLVLGLGNSATDIAVESSRIADATFLATRRGAYVLPKYMNGKPIDEVSTPIVSMLPLAVQRFFSMRMLGVAAGDMTAYGLPKPDHKLFEAHPTVSSELLPRLGHGDIEVKPNIDRFSGGRGIRFVDGSEEEIDLVVYCTGLQDDLPVLRPGRGGRARQPPAALPPGRLARAPGALLHRLHPAARADHAAGRGAGRMGRRPARRRGLATAPAEMRKAIAEEEARQRRSASLPLSVIRSRSTSIPTCARSGASESRLLSGSDDPGAPARRAGWQRHRGAAAVGPAARAAWPLWTRRGA